MEAPGVQLVHRNPLRVKVTTWGTGYRIKFRIQETKMQRNRRNRDTRIVAHPPRVEMSPTLVSYTRVAKVTLPRCRKFRIWRGGAEK